MENKFAKNMQAFFDDIDSSIESDPLKLALAFANHFWSGNGWEHRHSHQELKLPQDSISNVSILAHNTSLAFLTKRASLVADTTILTHYREETHAFYEYKDTPAQWGYGGDRNDTICYLRCANLRELGEWLKECKPLLLQGDLFYFPDILVHRVQESRYYEGEENVTDTEESIGPLCNLIIENRKLVDTTTTGIVRSNFIQPILKLDLPYIDNIDLTTFSKISSDEREGIQRFRDFLRLRFLDLKQNEGSESYDANLLKIELELRDGVRALNSDFNAVKRKTAFQVTGATIAAVTAYLVAINSASFGVLGQLLPGGGILAIGDALEKYLSEKHRIKDLPYYYLWLFSKKSKSEL